MSTQKYFQALRDLASTCPCERNNGYLAMLEIAMGGEGVLKQRARDQLIIRCGEAGLTFSEDDIADSTVYTDLDDNAYLLNLANERVDLCS